MKKYLLVFASYPEKRQKFFLEHMSKRNKEYCKTHNTEYIEITDKLLPYRDNLTWLKFKKVKDMIDDGFLKENDILVHMDADMLFMRTDIEFPCDKSFSYSIDSGNSHCMGCYSIRINEWSSNMIDLILDEDRYNELKYRVTVHEAFGYANSFWSEFREQASWYSLAGIKRHSWVPFTELPDYGWHSDKDEYTVYSLQDLHKNVQILPATWNVTEMPGESNCRFNINKVDKEDVIIRHYAGGQLWRCGEYHE